MKIIRYNTFETNSSSTHALVVPHNVDEANYSLYDSLDHSVDFGREECRLIEHYDEKLAYVYIVLRTKYECGKLGVRKKDLTAFKAMVNKLYKDVYNIVEYKPYKSDPKPNDIFKMLDAKTPSEWSADNRLYYSEGYVDHCEGYEQEFIDKILTDEQFVKRLLFNTESYITIGGDEYRGYNIKTIGFQSDYNTDNEYNVNEKGERCPDSSEYEDFEEWWNIREQYPIIRDDGGFYDKLEQYKKDKDVFLKGC